ncbi:MAG: hypothetical protein WC866_01325 [Patescibacteria group bacterium]|jgi:hypothetical protein
MAKNETTKKKFDPSLIEPLDGSPMISANCWNAVLETVDERARTEKRLRCLEWGAGNSTISLVRKGRKMENDFEFVSIEHETNFFHWLAESVLAEFLDGSSTNLKITWQPLAGAVIPLARLGATLKEHRALECASLSWQILLGNRRLQYIDGFRPQFDFSAFKLFKQAARLLLMKMGYALWLVKSVARSFISKSAPAQTHKLAAPTLVLSGASIKKGAFFEHFEENPVPGCLTIEQSGARVELWHLPALETVFWNKGVLLDGSIKQLFEYVCVPLNGSFDVVFIDGRARVSCIKRTHRDKLLKDGGSLFVHDAFRAEMAEGFRLFSPSFSFIRGSNTTLNGQSRCEEKFGMPLARVGDDLRTLRWEITQEMFTYKNSR